MAISIHAPRTGSDVSHPFLFISGNNFNPRSPHGERRPVEQALRQRRQHFNPRSPHGERRQLATELGNVEAISIHAPRTGSDLRGFPAPPTPKISIHAPRTGSDPRCSPGADTSADFNPRSPHGERHQRLSDPATSSISIHAPRTGSDARPSRIPSRSRHFNPRSPHGERPSLASGLLSGIPFQSTLPARGATMNRYTLDTIDAISIHAPRTGSDATQ